MRHRGSRSISHDGADESIPAPRQGLDEARIFRRVSQRLTDLVDGGVQIVIDVNERVRPQALSQLFPRDNGARLLQQNCQHLERLASQFQSHSRLAQFLRLKVNLNRSKANCLAGADLWDSSGASIGKSLTLRRVCATLLEVKEQRFASRVSSIRSRGFLHLVRDD